MEHDDRAVFDRKPIEGVGELVTVDDRPLLSGWAGSIRRRVTFALKPRRLRASSVTAWRRMRFSQASKRSGSRSRGRSRQHLTSASWTASSALSKSRRISRAIRNRWSMTWVMRTS